MLDVRDREPINSSFTLTSSIIYIDLYQFTYQPWACFISISSIVYLGLKRLNTHPKQSTSYPQRQSF